jgi:hypothetical protein
MRGEDRSLCRISLCLKLRTRASSCPFAVSIAADNLPRSALNSRAFFGDLDHTAANLKDLTDCESRRTRYAKQQIRIG